MNIENLIENVDSQIIKIRTKSLDVSFNELYDMYQNQELTISPDYQRMFRWEEEKQSRFVESLILEMPVPPIFVIETDDGIYELIDGLQRISSYLHFRGEKLGNSKDDYLILQGCDIVPDLNGLKFNDLPKALQIKLKRSFVRMEVIKKESEIALKYHMFKRLNTGGELLSAQEIRNCTIRLLGSKAIDFLEDCSQNNNFKSVISRIGDDRFNIRDDQELALRFFAIKNDIDNYRYPVTEYLTRYLEKMTKDEIAFNYTKEQHIFKHTFKFINDHWGCDAFSGKTGNGTVRNEFVLYYFDGIAIPLATMIDEIEKSNCIGKIVERINDLKFGDEIKSYKTGSVNGIKTRIRLFTEGVREVLDGK
ncbi:DUF262 domain-containing protein [Candidatus Soleaferrea massiliensis]|uniref:DUF262 domain-containing protein n=1 Tax=Candidatus Soleaferrea massiliensis TaxID=1470354 RepID=UPI00058E08C1|nr:DUF262 domain-containing protein [Candidatus Soleaferrea massiliensis]